MSETPFDLGIVTGSTCDDIWFEVMRQHPGLIALMQCFSRVQDDDPKRTARHYVQAVLRGNEDRLPALIEHMAPFLDKPLVEQENALRIFFPPPPSRLPTFMAAFLKDLNS